jgi:hypothetical protein
LVKQQAQEPIRQRSRTTGSGQTTGSDASELSVPVPSLLNSGVFDSRLLYSVPGVDQSRRTRRGLGIHGHQHRLEQSDRLVNRGFSRRRVGAYRRIAQCYGYAPISTCRTGIAFALVAVSETGTRLDLPPGRRNRVPRVARWHRPERRARRTGYRGSTSRRARLHENFAERNSARFGAMTPRHRARELRASVDQTEARWPDLVRWQSGRGDKTTLELFPVGLRAWDCGLRVLVCDRTSTKY